MPVARSLTLDRSVMHVSIAGDIPLEHPEVKAFDIIRHLERLLTFIDGSFHVGGNGAVPLVGFAYGEDDASSRQKAISTHSWDATHGLPRDCGRRD